MTFGRSCYGDRALLHLLSFLLRCLCCLLFKLYYSTANVRWLHKSQDRIEQKVTKATKEEKTTLCLVPKFPELMIAATEALTK